MARTDLTDSNLAERLNAFPLVLPTGAEVQYRIWAVDPIPLTSELREKIRSFLWQQTLHRPVFPMYVGDSFVYGVAGWDGPDAVQYVGEGERRYTISPTNDRRTIHLDSVEGTEAELAAAILQAGIVLHLRDDQTLSRGHDNTHFYAITPDRAYQPRLRRDKNVAPRHDQGEVDIFRGFTFRVIHLDDVGLCAVVDVRTNYVGRHTLASYLERGRTLEDIARMWSVERWIIDYGRVKQSVYVVGVGVRGIGDVVLKDGQSTYDYLRARYPAIRSRIAPGDRAVTMVYRRADERNEGKHYTGAASLLKPQFTTQSPQVRSLGDTSAFDPRERLKRIEAVRRRLDGAHFAGHTVAFGPAVRKPRTVLPLPDLLFGPSDKPTVLRAGDVARDERGIRRGWGAAKSSMLREHGPFRRQPFTNPTFVYPATLERDGLLDDFLEQTDTLCQEHGRVAFSPSLSSYLDDAHPRDIIKKIKGIADAGRSGFVLLALPTSVRNADLVYGGVKSTITLPSKCFSISKLRDKARDKRKMASYILGNALAMLVENGSRPWGLATPLAHDMHFGFDAATYGSKGGLMGAAVVSDMSGADIVFANEEISARERIDAKVIGKFVLQQLERFYEEHGRSPCNILFQRDGRLLDPERKGIARALARFADAHPLHPQPGWAMATVEKSTSVPLRLFRDINDGVDAPFGGTYVLQSAHVAYLVLAGYPSKQGTPRPVRVEIVDNNGDTLGMTAVLRDIFWLSQLNWNAPEIDISLPLILRFTDQKLERYAIDVEVDAGDDDDWGDASE